LLNILLLVIRRLLQLIPTLFFIAVVVFVLVHLLPGDPAMAMIGDRATAADIIKVDHQLGVDRPLWVQFIAFLVRLLHGDLGMSSELHEPVLTLVAQRVPVTLLLSVLAAIIAVVLAVPLAFVAALRHDREADAVIRGAFQVGLSMPVFYIGLLLLTFFGAQLHWFPVGGYGNGFFGHLYHLFLPALTLALSLSAILMRNLRQAILSVIASDYVDFARSKGLAARIILFRHVLRNALISTVTLFGLQVGSLLGGAVVTETVFAIPGAGRLMIDSIYGRDYSVVQGTTLCLAVIVSFSFLLTELFQAWLDPRISR
jgi:peptide/nickel transport system permease protein